MRRVVISPSFERSVKKLTAQEKKQLAIALEKLNSFLISGQAPFGLGFKKINHDKYEFRVDIRLRVIIKIEGDILYLVLAGGHEEVRRYLKNFR